MGLLQRGSADQRAEEPSQVGDTNSHGADGRLSFENGGYGKDGKAGRREQASCAQVVHYAPQAVFPGGEHAIDKGAIRTRSSHDEKIARVFPMVEREGYLTGGDKRGLPGEWAAR